MPPRVAEPLSFYAIVALFAFLHAEVAKLADAPDLGSGGAILRGSSPLLGKYLNMRSLQYAIRQLSTRTLDKSVHV